VPWTTGAGGGGRKPAQARGRVDPVPHGVPSAVQSYGILEAGEVPSAACVVPGALGWERRLALMPTLRSPSEKIDPNFRLKKSSFPISRSP